jgi:hypothetical protein
MYRSQKTQILQKLVENVGSSINQVSIEGVCYFECGWNDLTFQVAL